MAPDSGASHFSSRRITKLFALFLVFSISSATACQFYPIGEYLKFVRVPENLQLGAEVLSLEVHPRSHLTIMPVDKEEDARYFTYKDVNSTHISVILAQSLEDLVDSETPRNLLKFRFVCDYSDGINSLTSSHLSVTVYVEDINDHAPQFIGAPYHVTVEEFTPPGMTIFRGIHALDGDKPNTPNSDVHYAIIKGNEDGKFSLESGHRTALILRKPLDYDTGDRQFSLVITATDRGTPAKSASTAVTVNVVDNDDLGPKFTHDTYRARIYESFPFPKGAIYQEIRFDPPIRALDQDAAINTPIKYHIISGNERGLFKIDPRNGSLFLIHPIDLDTERGLSNNTFYLQIHATQVDNPLKYTVARIEIEVLDLNDNLPEFEVDYYNISIVENLPNGFSVLQVIAHDNDQGDNAEFMYELDDPMGAFSVDGKSGWLTVRDERILDREKTSFLRMKVSAIEKKINVLQSGNLSASVPVEITLLDANDNNPIFLPSNIYEFVTKSDVKIGTVLGKVVAVDSDLGRNGIVRYGLQRTGNNGSDLRVPFSVDAVSGVVTVVDSPIIVGRHAIFVEATDQPVNPSERRFSLAVVTVDVFQNDANGGSMPDFVGAPYEFWVGANVPIGTSVGQIRINNAAEKKNNIVYDLLHSYREGVPFAVEEQSGTITVIDDIERYVRRSYDFEAVVTNEKDLTLVTNVSVHVVDPNDERDLFTKGTTRAPLVFHAKENQERAFIGQILPRNGTNTTNNVRFLIANQRDVPDIAITEDGDLYTVRGLDREMRQNYSITVIAETTKGLGIFQVTVVIDDVNDNPPVFDHPTYEGHIEENSSPGTEVILKTRITTHDADDEVNKKFGLSLDGEDSELFTIDRTTGRVFFGGKGNSVLDREEKSVYNLRVIATDDINPKSVASLQIKIDDVNDNAPTFTQMIVSPDHGIVVTKDKTIHDNPKDKINEHHSPVLLVPENITIGTVIIRLVSSDKDTDNNGEITYGIVNETIYPPSLKSKNHFNKHFVINRRTGELSISRMLPQGRDIKLTIFAKDSGNLTDHVDVRMKIVDVNDHAPVFNKSWYSFDVPEGHYIRKKIGTITAIDVDDGENARVAYRIVSTNFTSNLTFEVNSVTGDILITGDLDREIDDNYKIIVGATDNGKPQQSSTVDVEINVLDTNDNPPEFHGFVDVTIANATKIIPIYHASVSEDTPIGTTISRIYANDTDFMGNGNGLILFDLPHSIGEKKYFEIDSKDGAIMTISELDYERQEVHNVTITARDLGSPSLTSTALLYVKILDVDEANDRAPERPVFQHRYYEVEIEENPIVPLVLLQLNVSEGYVNHRIKYSILSNDPEIHKLFEINQDNGTVVLRKTVDREFMDFYEFKVKVEWPKIGRGLPLMIYPIGGDKLGDLKINEAKVVVRIRDTNDNSPRFKNKGKPLLAAIPASVNYGYEILKVEAEDPDAGINGEIRYQILGQDDAPRFAIDPLSGQVRAVSSFSREAGRVFGFDVKATDKRGSENGRSSIANVFVYVVDDNKQVVLVIGKKPTEIEDQVEEITSTLQNVTGLDVRVRKLEPHIEKNLIDTSSTDLYLYAVDPSLNAMIDMDTLHSVFRKKKSTIKQELEKYRVLEISRNSVRNGSRYLLSTLEVGVVVLGCVVFIGALITAICVACVRKNKRRSRNRGLGGPPMFSSGGPVGFALAEPTASLRKGAMFPTFVDGLRYDPEPFANDGRMSLCEHEPGCIRHHHRLLPLLASSARLRRYRPKRVFAKRQHFRHPKFRSRSCGTSKRMPKRATSTGCLEASATSLHSSGQDSGIVARPCHCGHSSSPSSGDSSNGYEDSLKSLHRSNDHIPRGHDAAATVAAVGERHTVVSGGRQRFHSFSNGESIYGRETSLRREMRYRTQNEKRQRGQTEPIHVSRTIIRDHGPVGIDKQNITRLHGAAGSSHSLFW